MAAPVALLLILSFYERMEPNAPFRDLVWYAFGAVTGAYFVFARATLQPTQPSKNATVVGIAIWFGFCMAVVFCYGERQPRILHVRLVGPMFT